MCNDTKQQLPDTQRTGKGVLCVKGWCVRGTQEGKVDHDKETVLHVEKRQVRDQTLAATSPDKMVTEKRERKQHGGGLVISHRNLESKEVNEAEGRNGASDGCRKQDLKQNPNGHIGPHPEEKKDSGTSQPLTPTETVGK